MTNTINNTDTDEQWRAIRKEAGRKIDPETADVEWFYAQTLDPYGIHPDLPEEYQQVGREYFARSPASDIWVHFSDLPDTIADALWNKHRKKLAFPAGLEVLTDHKLNVNLPEDTLQVLQVLVETGQLTKEGQQWLKRFLEIRTVEQVLEIIDYATAPASLSTTEALAFLEQIETGVSCRMGDFHEELRTNDCVS